MMALRLRAVGAPAQPSLDWARTWRMRWMVVTVARTVMRPRVTARYVDPTMYPAGRKMSHVPAAIHAGSAKADVEVSSRPSARIAMRTSRGASPMFAMPVPVVKPRLSDLARV